MEGNIQLTSPLNAKAPLRRRRIRSYVSHPETKNLLAPYAVLTSRYGPARRTRTGRDQPTAVSHLPRHGLGGVGRAERRGVVWLCAEREQGSKDQGSQNGDSALTGGQD